MSSSSWHHLSQIRLSAATARQVGAMEMSPIYIYIYILPDVKIIHYFLRRKPYFNFEINKSTQRPTKYYNSARFLAVEMSKKCTALWREAHFQVKIYKTLGVRTTFGSWDVEKVHAVVARSTFWSQHVKSTRGSDDVWRLRCRFAWQAHEIVDLVKSEQNIRVLQHVDKRWQAWDIWRSSANLGIWGSYQCTVDGWMDR